MKQTFDVWAEFMQALVNSTQNAIDTYNEENQPEEKGSTNDND